MKAVRFHQCGGPEVLGLEEIPDPIPAAGEILLRVRVCGPNHLDVVCRADVSRLPFLLPHTLRREIAGEVVPFDIIEFFRREIDLLGSYRATSTELRQIFHLAVEGRLRPVIHAALPLAEAAEAHRVMEGHEHFGKLVLVP